MVSFCNQDITLTYPSTDAVLMLSRLSASTRLSAAERLASAAALPYSNTTPSPPRPDPTSLCSLADYPKNKTKQKADGTELQVPVSFLRTSIALAESAFLRYRRIAADAHWRTPTDKVALLLKAASRALGITAWMTLFETNMVILWQKKSGPGLRREVDFAQW